VGILLVVGAIVVDARAYGRLPGAGHASRKGIVVSLAAGVVIGLFYPFVAKALTGAGHLGPYTVYFVFALGAIVSTFPFNYFLMRRPVVGPSVSMADYFAGPARAHWWGLAGGLIWGVGTLSNFVASYVPTVGPAASFALGQGNTMISALWGVMVWKEFRGADRGTVRLLAVMFVLFVLGLTTIALAPVVGGM
jgi:glucose uptake protein